LRQSDKITTAHNIKLYMCSHLALTKMILDSNSYHMATEHWAKTLHVKILAKYCQLY